MTVLATPEALLRAIAASPGDDLPRLAYADWLEENGVARDQATVAMIRQRFPASIDLGNPEGKAWHQRAIELIGHLIPESRIGVWRGPGDPDRRDVFSQPLGDPWHADSPRLITQLPTVRNARVCFRHGYVYAVAMTQDRYVKIARALLSEHPIEHVCLPACPNIALKPGGRFRGVVRTADVQNLPADEPCVWGRCESRRSRLGNWLVRPGLFEMLAGEPTCNHNLVWPVDCPIHAYPTIEDALKDLEQACLRFGRSR